MTARLRLFIQLWLVVVAAIIGHLVIASNAVGIAASALWISAGVVEGWAAMRFIKRFERRAVQEAIDRQQVVDFMQHMHAEIALVEARARIVQLDDRLAVLAGGGVRCAE